jgi:hypothetical protein
VTYEEEQALLTQNREMKTQLETLTTTLKALTQPEPTKVLWKTWLSCGPRHLQFSKQRSSYPFKLSQRACKSY